MDCPDCGAQALAVPVPAEYRSSLPGDEPGVAICEECLTLQPEPDPPSEVPDLQRLSDAFPTSQEAALPMVLVVGLLENLALYRSEISDLLAAVEQAGTDPLLVLDRLARDPDLDPAANLADRRRHLEQLL
jgi:hypothetical protein